MPVPPLRVHVLNVGDGDSMIIEFPDVGGHKFAVVDCYKYGKTKDYLDKLGASELEFVCATHPHYDHIRGLPNLLENYRGHIREFWDSGFRHTSLTHGRIVDLIQADAGIRFMRVTSGYEREFNGVKVTVLAPSISLRNRYDTYGVNINNASIVLKLEYQDPDKKRPSVIILGGDAQFDSWAKVLEEFPHYVRTENPEQKIRYTESFNPLNCQVLKVAHHGSKHGTALEYVEVLDPEHAVVSCSGSSQYGFPHQIAELALRDVLPANILYTDHKPPDGDRSGTVVITNRGTTTVNIEELHEPRAEDATPP